MPGPLDAPSGDAVARPFSRRNAVIRLGLRSVTAAFFLLAAVLLLSRFWVAAGWPGVLGAVEAVGIVPVGDPNDSRAPGEQAQPLVQYRYTVEGVTHTGSRVSVFDLVFRDRERAQVYLNRYGIRTDARIPVYYDPEDPGTALLVRAVPWWRFEVIAGMLFLVLLPVAVVGFSAIDLFRGGPSRRTDRSRGRFW